MSVYRETPDGRWVPDEHPLPEPFGIVWERFWKLRRERGERSIAAFVRSFFDARAVA